MDREKKCNSTRGRKGFGMDGGRRSRMGATFFPNLWAAAGETFLASPDF